jgi:hypothetical protein
MGYTFLVRGYCLNQETVKNILNEVESCELDYTLVFSGKANSKVNGLYKPDKAEIVIHNRNFESDDQLVYTALHEYAHHIHHAQLGKLNTRRSHTQEFWGIFHRLVRKAEEQGSYKNVFESEPEFIELTRVIKDTCIRANGEILLEFGRLLAKASDLCKTHKTRFEDYIERVLGIPKATAASAVAAQHSSLDPGLGWDGLTYVASIRDPEQRNKAIQALNSGASPTSVRGLLKGSDEPADPADRLLAEKNRLERTIRSLTERLTQIEERLSEL